jgi:hypothetical protein
MMGESAGGGGGFGGDSRRLWVGPAMHPAGALAGTLHYAVDTTVHVAWKHQNVGSGFAVQEGERGK